MLLHLVVSPKPLAVRNPFPCLLPALLLIQECSNFSFSCCSQNINLGSYVSERGFLSNLFPSSSLRICFSVAISCSGPSDSLLGITP